MSMAETPKSLLLAHLTVANFIENNSKSVVVRVEEPIEPFCTARQDKAKAIVINFPKVA
jgi:hypothetical protein